MRLVPGVLDCFVSASGSGELVVEGKGVEMRNLSEWFRCGEPPDKPFPAVHWCREASDKAWAVFPDYREAPHKAFPMVRCSREAPHKAWARVRDYREAPPKPFPMVRDYPEAPHKAWAVVRDMREPPEKAYLGGSPDEFTSQKDCGGAKFNHFSCERSLGGKCAAAGGCNGTWKDAAPS